MNATSAPDLLARPTAEDWLAHRLTQLGHILDPGIALKDRLRHAITTQGIGMLILGRAPGGKPETLEEAFARVFSEPLVPPVSRGTRSTQRKVSTS